MCLWHVCLWCRSDHDMELWLVQWVWLKRRKHIVWLPVTKCTCLLSVFPAKTKDLLFEGSRKAGESPIKLSTVEQQVADSKPMSHVLPGQLRLDTKGQLCSNLPDTYGHTNGAASASVSREDESMDAEATSDIEFNHGRSAHQDPPSLLPGQMYIDPDGHLCSGIKGVLRNSTNLPGSVICINAFQPLSVDSGVLLIFSLLPFNKHKCIYMLQFVALPARECPLRSVSVSASHATGPAMWVLAPAFSVINWHATLACDSVLVVVVSSARSAQYSSKSSWVICQICLMYK